jgi:hypothetical protein
MSSKAHTISLLLCLSLEILLVARVLPQVGVADRVLTPSWHVLTLTLLGATILLLLSPVRRGSTLHRIFGCLLGVFPGLLFGLYGYIAFMVWTHE